jgi:hypothetical protein
VNQPYKTNPTLVGFSTEATYYQTDSTAPISMGSNTMYQYSEHSLLGSGRITRYSLPLVSYDYKCGNYLGI